MTEAQIAITVSGTAMIISLLSLIWTIRSHSLFPKAKVRVSYTILADDFAPIGKRLFLLECSNLGPTELVLRCPMFPTIKPSRADKRIGYWSFARNQQNPKGGASVVDGDTWPRKINVGEVLTVLFSDEEVRKALENRAYNVGFLDTFDRFHTIPLVGFKNIVEVVNSADG